MIIESRIEQLRHQAGTFYKLAVLNAGAAAFNTYVAATVEGNLTKVSTTTAAVTGALAVGSVIVGWREHIQADRLEAGLVEHQSTSSSMEAPIN